MAIAIGKTAGRVKDCLSGGSPVAVEVFLFCCLVLCKNNLEPSRQEGHGVSRGFGMTRTTGTSGSELFLVDNSDVDWKVLRYLHDWCQIAKGLDIATGYFEIGSMVALKDEWHVTNTYLPQVQSSVGGKPALKCWMELG